MGTVIITFGGVAVMCASGFVVSTAMKWFHTYEVDINEIRERRRAEAKSRASRRLDGGDKIDSRVESIRKKANI